MDTIIDPRSILNSYVKLSLVSEKFRYPPSHFCVRSILSLCQSFLSEVGGLVYPEYVYDLEFVAGF